MQHHLACMCCLGSGNKLRVGTLSCPLLFPGTSKMPPTQMFNECLEDECTDILQLIAAIQKIL